MDELKKFVMDGGNIVKNGKRVWYQEDTERFCIMVDFDGNDEEDFGLSVETGYYKDSKSFNVIYKELCQK